MFDSALIMMAIASLLLLFASTSVAAADATESTGEGSEVFPDKVAEWQAMRYREGLDSSSLPFTPKHLHVAPPPPLRRAAGAMGPAAADGASASAWAPLRIAFDTRLIDTPTLDTEAAKGPQACTAVGQQVRLGTAAASTTECVANQYSNCYIVCAAADLATAEVAGRIKALAKAHIADFFGRFLSVRRDPAAEGSAGDSLTVAYCGQVADSAATVPGADVVVFLSARPTRSPTVTAIAYACHLSTTDQRPTAIFLNIPPTVLAKLPAPASAGGSGSDTDADSDADDGTGVAGLRAAMRNALRREFVHGLGFTASMMRYFRHPSDPTGAATYFSFDRTLYPKGPVVGDVVTVDMDTAAGHGVEGPNLNDALLVDDPANKVGLVTPKVLAWARAYFGCPTLAVVELENQGGPGAAGAHFEERIYMTELLAPQIKVAGGRLTGLTLSLLEDMGWYAVAPWAYGVGYGANNGGVVEPAYFGRGAGCGFAEKRCDDRTANPQWPFDGHVANAAAAETFCTHDAKFMGVGGVFEYPADLPAAGRYFPSNPRLGGGVAQADFCPYVRENNANGNCRNSSHSYLNPQFLGNKAGPSSRCFVAETTKQQSNFYAPPQGLCYQTVCTSPRTIALRVGDEYYPCPEGGRLQIDYQRRDTAYEGPKEAVGPLFVHRTSSVWKALIACPSAIERHICGLEFADGWNSDVTFAFFSPPLPSDGASPNISKAIGRFPFISSITVGAAAAVGSTITMRGGNFDSCSAILLGGMRHAFTVAADGEHISVRVSQMTPPYGGYGISAMGEMDVSLVCTLRSAAGSDRGFAGAAVGDGLPNPSPQCAGEGCIIATAVTFTLVPATTAPPTTTTTVDPAATTSTTSAPPATTAVTAVPPTGGGGSTTTSATAGPSGGTATSTPTAGPTVAPTAATTRASTTPAPSGRPTDPPMAAAQCSGETTDAMPSFPYPQAPRFSVRLLPVLVGGGGENGGEGNSSSLQAFLEESITIIPPSLGAWEARALDMTAVNISRRDVATEGPPPDAHPFLTTLKMKASVWKRNDLNLILDLLPTPFPADGEQYLAFQFISGAKSTSVVHTDGPTTIEGTGVLTVPDSATNFNGGPNFPLGLTSVARTAATLRMAALSDLVTYRPPFEAYIAQAATTEIPAVTNGTTRWRAGSTSGASKGPACPAFRTDLPEHSGIIFFRMLLLPDEDYDDLVEDAKPISLIAGAVSLASSLLSATPAFSMMVGRAAGVPTLATCDFATDEKLPFPLMPAGDYAVGEGKMRLHRGNVRVILMIYAAWIVIGLVLGILVWPFMTMSPHLSCLQRLWKAYGGARMPSLWSVPVFFFTVGCLLSTTALTANLALGEGGDLSLSSSFIDIMSKSSSESVLGRNPPTHSLYRRAKEYAIALGEANKEADGDLFIPDVVVCAVSYAVHLLFLTYLVVRLTSGFGAAALPEEGAGFAALDAEKKTRGMWRPALKWVNDPEDATGAWNNFVLHYTFYFSAYTEPWQAFILFEYSISILLGILLGVQIEQHCLIIAVVFTVLNAILLLGLVVTRPHATIVAWALNTAMALVATLAGLLAVVGIIKRRPENEGAVPDTAISMTKNAIILSMVCVAFVAPKLLHDLVLFVAYCFRGKWRLGIDNDGEQYIGGKAVILGGKDGDDRPPEDGSAPKLSRHASNVGMLPTAPAPLLAPMLSDETASADDFFNIDSGDGGATDANAAPSAADDEIELSDKNDGVSDREEVAGRSVSAASARDDLSSIHSDGADAEEEKAPRRGVGQKRKKVFRETDLTENGVNRNATLQELITAKAGVSDEDI